MRALPFGLMLILIIAAKEGQGARCCGIDISMPIVKSAAGDGHRLGMTAAVADVRALPFAANAFDAIYSMGTIEHFAEWKAAVREMAGVLRPGGRLILGVPNRYDPFMRPLLVACLRRFALYPYGDERSFSRAELRALIEDVGLTVTIETGILFIPGWLRMLDLWCHTRWPAGCAVTAPAVRLFASLDARVPALRRHGYLLASVGVKPPSA